MAPVIYSVSLISQIQKRQQAAGRKAKKATAFTKGPPGEQDGQLEKRLDRLQPEGSVRDLSAQHGGTTGQLKQLQADVEAVSSAVGKLEGEAENMTEPGSPTASSRRRDSQDRNGGGRRAAQAATEARMAEASAKLGRSMAATEAPGRERDCALKSVKAEIESLHTWIEALNEEMVAGRRDSQAMASGAVPLVGHSQCDIRKRCILWGVPIPSITATRVMSPQNSRAEDATQEYVS